MSSVGNDSSNEVNRVFEEAFQKPLLEQTDRFYQQESKEFLENHPFREYIKKCSSRMDEEKQRISRYLNERLLEPLINTVENALVVKHIDKFIEEFKKLLDENNIKGLKILCAVFDFY